MPHVINRAAFLSASAKAGVHPLLSAYVRLVAIEIALKDNQPTWPVAWGHDVVMMIGTLNDPGLNPIRQRLRDQLSSIKCTHRSGTQVPVCPEKYPDLRYTRHESDFLGGTTDADLLALNGTIDEIITQLRSKKVPL